MSDERYWKTDHEGWYYDSETGAIINRDENAYIRHKLAVMEERKRKQTEQEIDNLKKDVADIKTLLQAIYGKLNG